MLLQQGQLELQNAQLTYLEGLYFGLFVTNLTITPTTSNAAVTGAEAAWTGYARQTIASWPPASTVSGTAVTAPTTLLTFANSSGSAQTFYGWFAINPTSGNVVAATNIGPQTVPPSSNYSFSVSCSDVNTGP